MSHNPASTPEWIERMRRIRVAEVALALGRRPATPRGASGGGVFGCPACGAERRHPQRRDRRPAVGFRHDGRGFHCFSCETSGDSIDLVALLLRGKRYGELQQAGKEETRAWCCRWLGIELSGRAATLDVQVAAPRAVRDEPDPPPIQYPPVHELRALWTRTVAVDRDTGVAAYLAARGLDPAAIAKLDLARALQTGQWLPCWAARGRATWLVGAYRLIVPLYDHAGKARSILARCIAPNVEPKFKSTAPRGFGRAGLVMACPVARRMLGGGAGVAAAPTRVVVTEGEIDFLVWAASAATDTATLALYSGGWDDQVADRVPDGSTVLIATDLDAEGDRYADRVIDSFDGREMDLRRWRGAALPNPTSPAAEPSLRHA